MIVRVLVVLVLAGGLAALTYLRLERIGRRGWVPLACRAVAWAALGLLLLNLSCPVAVAPRRPLVLLDASLSLTAAGGRWSEATPTHHTRVAEIAQPLSEYIGTGAVQAFQEVGEAFGPEH